MQVQKEHLKVCNNIGLLAEPFRTEIKFLIRVLAETPETKILKPFETLRSKSRQEYLYRSKRSKTMNSKHLCGWACDFVPHTLMGWSWADRDITGDGTTKDELEAFKKMRTIVKTQFPKLKLLGEWDMAHVELR